MTRDSAVRVVTLYPDLLGTYGDGGNALVLARRLEWRGVPVERVEVTVSQPVPASGDIYLLGGGEDDAQSLAANRLRESGALRQAVDGGAVVLAVCAGLQVVGESFTDGQGRQTAGLGLLDASTRRRGVRAVGEVVVEVDPDVRPIGSAAPALPRLTGFENHGGATTIGGQAKALGRVVTGVGNGAGDPVEGAVQGRVLATYLHGPVLARNPALADLVLSWATRTSLAPLELPEVDLLRRRTIAAAMSRAPRRGRTLPRTPRSR